jgi:hypothetical protein
LKVTEGPLKSSSLSRTWNEVEWNVIEEQRVTADAEAARDGTNRVDLYPSLGQKSKEMGVYFILREFGNLLYGQCDEKLKRRWTHKLGLPSLNTVAAVQRKICPEFGSYHGVVESFKTAMDRYVALNLCNALIVHGVPFAQATNLKLKVWGATQEYASGKRYHVLIPLVSAYASKEIFENFGAAFADWLCQLNGISESSVADATHDIIRAIVETL